MDAARIVKPRASLDDDQLSASPKQSQEQKAIAVRERGMPGKFCCPSSCRRASQEGRGLRPCGSGAIGLTIPPWMFARRRAHRTGRRPAADLSLIEVRVDPRRRIGGVSTVSGSWRRRHARRRGRRAHVLPTGGRPAAQGLTMPPLRRVRIEDVGQRECQPSARLRHSLQVKAVRRPERRG